MQLVDFVHRLPGLGPGSLETHEGTVSHHVVDQHVHPAVSVKHGAGKPVDVVEPPHIHDVDVRRASRSFDVFLRLLRPLGVDSAISTDAP